MSLRVISLSDSHNGAEAAIAPDFGFNCFQFRVPLPSDRARPLDILWSAPDFLTGNARPSGSGIPLLCPFPGRIRGLTFSWQGREYALEEGDGRGNAIHGFVHKRPWRVIEQTASRVVGEFRPSLDDPTLLQRWPSDFSLRAAYEVQRNTLRGTYTISNRGDQPMPFGFGTHAYFRVPLGGPAADDCRLHFDVDQAWELDNMHATGRHSPVAEAAAYSQGLPFAAAKFDNVFTALPDKNSLCTTRIVDPHSGVEVRQAFSSDFKHLVAYTPPHREAVCLEPYTCVPDCFRLERQGIPSGLRILAPGESFTTQIDIAVHHNVDVTRRGR